MSLTPHDHSIVTQNALVSKNSSAFSARQSFTTWHFTLPSRAYVRRQRVKGKPFFSQPASIHNAQVTTRTPPPGRLTLCLDNLPTPGRTSAFPHRRCPDIPKPRRTTPPHPPSPAVTHSPFRDQGAGYRETPRDEKKLTWKPAASHRACGRPLGAFATPRHPTPRVLGRVSARAVGRCQQHGTARRDNNGVC